MSGPFPFNAVPGFRAKIESEESAPMRAGREGQTNITQLPYIIDSAAVDDADSALLSPMFPSGVTANSPTTTIRGGSVMILPDGATELLPYRSTRSGTIAGVLPRHVSTLINATATDKWTGLFTSGFLRASEIPNLDYYAAAQLYGMGFYFDVPRYNVHYNAIRRIVSSNDDLTLTAATHHGTRIVQTVTGKTITLPTLQRGLYIEIQCAEAAVTVNTGNSTEDKLYGAAGIGTLHDQFSTVDVCAGFLGDVVTISSTPTLVWIVTHRVISTVS